MITIELEKMVGNKVSLAYTVLRDRIVNGSYEYGEVLSANALSPELNMSRTPILEAFKLLEREEMVSVIPQVGVIVKPLNLSEISARYEVLAVIEGYIAGEAAIHCQAADNEKLEHIIQLMKQELQQQDGSKMFELNNLFHDTIRDIADKSYATNLCRQLRKSQDWHTHWKEILFNPSNNALSFKEHQECYLAIVNHDMQKARAVMEQHVLRTRNQFLILLGGKL